MLVVKTFEQHVLASLFALTFRSWALRCEYKCMNRMEFRSSWILNWIFFLLLFICMPKWLETEFSYISGSYNISSNFTLNGKQWIGNRRTKSSELSDNDWATAIFPIYPLRVLAAQFLEKKLDIVKVNSQLCREFLSNAHRMWLTLLSAYRKTVYHTIQSKISTITVCMIWRLFLIRHTK